VELCLLDLLLNLSPFKGLILDGDNELPKQLDKNAGCDILKSRFLFFYQFDDLQITLSYLTNNSETHQRLFRVEIFF
jgi:hypothetical protein